MRHPAVVYDTKGNFITLSDGSGCGLIVEAWGRYYEIYRAEYDDGRRKAYAVEVAENMKERQDTLYKYFARGQAQAPNKYGRDLRAFAALPTSELSGGSLSGLFGGIFGGL